MRPDRRIYAMIEYHSLRSDDTGDGRSMRASALMVSHGWATARRWAPELALAISGGFASSSTEIVNVRFRAPANTPAHVG